ncbi:protein tyrosine phosphatase-like protein, PTPLA domain-containing protein [Sarocladium implicatum]|nr:protein tyrosine phosphatase-like protein, PTPLA domain-containing protein [Sarocladium implicatum]
MAALSFSWRAWYLTTYNLTQASLWTSLFVLVLSSLEQGPAYTFATCEPLARWIQTFALLDVVHAAVRLVPSGTATTFTQVGTRVIQVWAIWWAFPEAILGSDFSERESLQREWYGAPSGTLAFVALLLAWSVADAVRYAYLVCKMHGFESRLLTWIRYSMFYALYPVGISAEWWLMYRSIDPLSRVSAALPPLFYFLLALYVPGAWFMFSHMTKQRRKVLGKRG